MKHLDEQVLGTAPVFKTKTAIKILLFPIYLIYLVGKDMFEESA